MCPPLILPPYSLPSTTRHSQSDKIEGELIPNGDSAFSQGDYERAGDLYDQAVSIDPHHLGARLRRGDTLFTMARYREAYNDYAHVMENRPQDDHIIARYGVLMYCLGYLPDALNILTNACRINPNNVLALAYSGEIYRVQTKPNLELALRQLDSALSIDSSYYYALIFRGTTYRDLKRPRDAIVDYTLALQRFPEDLLTRARRATIFFQIGEYEKSREDIEQGLAIAPKFDRFLYLKQELVRVLDGPLVAEQQQAKYTLESPLTRSPSCIDIEGRCFKPIIQYPLATHIANTREFSSDNTQDSGSGAAHNFIVKKSRSYPSGVQDFSREAAHWDAAHPTKPSRFFMFRNGDCRLVLPKLSGEPLSNFIWGRPISVALFLQIGLIVGLELQYLHQSSRVIHGDLKLDNVLISRENGLIKINLIDFGNSDAIGACNLGYKGKKSPHIAPEMYSSPKIQAHPSQDVYSFAEFLSNTELMNVPNGSNNLPRQSIPAAIKEYFAPFMSAIPEDRPSLPECLKIICRLILENPESAPAAPVPENLPYQPLTFLSQLIETLDPDRLILLFDVIDRFDSRLQGLVKENPSLLQAITGKFTPVFLQNYANRFQGFIKELIEHTNKISTTPKECRGTWQPVFHQPAPPGVPSTLPPHAP
jgi:tetratricopeptide (TPR) repeat protein